MIAYLVYFECEIFMQLSNISILPALQVRADKTREVKDGHDGTYVLELLYEPCST